MRVSEFYLHLRLAHVICVGCSGGLFAIRGLMVLAANPRANHLALRWLSYLIDSALLAAAVMLMITGHQYPFVQDWLTVKILLLAVYIVLGSYALRRARTAGGQRACFAAALLVFLFIVSVAYWHDPRGVFAHGVTFPWR